MTATGNITSDVEALRDLIAPGSHSTRSGQWPWSPPASDESLARASAEYPGIPEDVLELFSITETFHAGYFRLEEPLDIMLDYAPELTALFAEMVDDPPPPTGRQFWMNENGTPRSAVEVGGPCHGRLFSADPQVGWRTVAWNLSDAIACTRELYEADWFQWKVNPCHVWLEPGEVRVDIEETFQSLKPIIDRWNCSPLIADFYDGQYYEPERPSAQRRGGSF